MYHNILVPVDLSNIKQAKKLIGIAQDMLIDDNSELHVMTVVPTYNMPIVGSHFPKDFEEKTLQDVGDVLKQTLDVVETPSGNIKGHVTHGNIYDEIMKVADKLNCELIVLASHRPELKDYLLGPNAARVVRHAKQSVFVVRD